MTIGINAVAAFKQPRTGVENYVYQLIKHLTMLEESQRHRFILYTQTADRFDFDLPSNFQIRRLRWPINRNWGFWAQIRLAAEMIWRMPETLFIPVHVLPMVHPQNSVVTIHGLEFEHFPKFYPKIFLRYIRYTTKHAVKRARKIITISENSKKDLVDLYGADKRKITVIYHGFEQDVHVEDINKPYPYILFIGRIETKKNVDGLIRAFDLLKTKYNLPHKLILGGRPGYGYDMVKNAIQQAKYKQDIIEKGYISDRDKWILLSSADLFAFPTHYEGFGIPILEAQSMGCPVVSSNNSCISEVAGQGGVLIDPTSIEQISQAMYKVISNDEYRNELTAKGLENVKRFSWAKCARETLAYITG